MKVVYAAVIASFFAYGCGQRHGLLNGQAASSQITSHGKIFFSDIYLDDEVVSDGSIGYAAVVTSNGETFAILGNVSPSSSYFTDMSKNPKATFDKMARDSGYLNFDVNETVVEIHGCVAVSAGGDGWGTSTYVFPRPDVDGEFVKSILIDTKADALDGCLRKAGTTCRQARAVCSLKP